MRFAGSLVASFFTLAAAAQAASLPGGSLDQLLAKARAASGSPYKYHVISKARETIGGKTFTVISEVEGVKYLAKRCAGQVCEGFYFDGEHSYNTNLNDTALPISASVDGLQLTLRAISSYAFAAPDFRSNGGRVSDRDVLTRAGGKRYRRLTVAANRGSVLDAIVDADSGLVIGVISAERKLAFEFRDQRKVDGKIVVPWEIWLDGKRLERFDSRAVSSEPLSAPRGLVPSFAGGAASVAMLESPHPSDAPVAECSIGGQQAPCLLDTGSSGLSMSHELAQKLGLNPSTSLPIAGLGEYVSGVVQGPSLSIGSATFGPATYVVLSDIHAFGYDLVLGADVFAHARVTIDYAKRAITVAPSDAAGSGGIPFAFQDFVPIVTLHLGESAVPLAVDTGDESSINLAYEYYAQHPELFKPSGKREVGGIGGTSEEVTGEVPSARIAEFTVENAQIGATKRLTALAKGHLGSGFLSHFTVVFDYTRARISLTPRPGDAAVRSSDGR